MDVQFDEEDPLMMPKRKKPVKKLSFFTKLAYKLKLAKTEAEAQRVILITSLTFLGLSFFLFFDVGGLFS